MPKQFIKYAQEAQRFVEMLAQDLGCPNDHDKARRVLKAVLHTVRDRILISESFQLMAQLPTILKGIFVEDWKYSEKPLKFHTTDSLWEALLASEHLAEPDDFPNKEYAIFAVNTVFKNLGHFVSAGELQDVIAQLPTAIKEVIDFDVTTN